MFVVILINTIRADVIFHPYPNFGAAISLEGIGSYEFSFTKYNTLNFWGTFGVVTIFGNFKSPAYGTGSAVELRHYFKGDSFEKFNIGLYAGSAYMRHPYFYNGHLTEHDNSVGFVPGFKLTYKHRFNSWLIGEPYVGFSTPWYEDDFSKLFNWIARSTPGVMLTFGIRVGFNKVRF